MKYIFVILWTVLIIGATLYVDNNYVDIFITPKWLITNTIVFLLLAIVPYCKSFFHSSMSYLLEVIAMMVCFFEAIISLLQYGGLIVSFGSFSAGSFDNAAGLCSCLALSFPLCFDFFDKMNNYEKGLFISGKLICVLPIILYGARISIFSVIIVFLLMVCIKKRIRYKSLSTLLLAAFLLVIFAFTKNGSTRGRLFIYERTFEMIREKPILGWGKGGFAKKYMNFQENYFRNHPRDNARFLAGDIRNPLSDYLLIWVEYGSIAFLFVIIMITFFFVAIFPKSDNEGNTGKLIILSIIIIAAFSYPFSYPFTWIMLAYAITNTFKRFFIRRKRLTYKVHFLIIIIILISEHAIYKEVLVEKEWKKVTQRTKYPFSENLLSQYASLYPKMHYSPEFLYNYSSVLYEIGKYNQACALAMESKSKASNYNVCLLLADIYRESGDIEKSVHFFKKAHYMCPSRITPLYGIFSIYRQYGYTKIGRQLAIRILAMPDKVISKDSKEIRQDLYNYVNNQQKNK